MLERNPHGDVLEKKMSGGGWGCPHDENGICAKRDAPCNPGEPGCVLEERMKPKGNNVKEVVDEAGGEK